MAKFSGIEIGLSNLCSENLAQALVVLFDVFLFFGFGPLGFVFFIYLFFTKYYYLAILYGAWMWYDWDTCERGGRRFKFVRSQHFWEKLTNYFPIDVTVTSAFDPHRNYIFACHPHGVCSFGPFGVFGYDNSPFNKLGPQIRTTILILKTLFSCPFAREFFQAFGACAVSKKSIEHLLTKRGTGNGLVLLPGGLAEAYESHPHSAVLVLKNRKGFVKLAIEYGADLVPVYTFGENDVYNALPNPEGSLIRKLQEKFKDILGFPLLLINGRGIFQSFFGPLPHRRPMHTIVGSPITVEKLEHPSQEVIDKYHTLYVDNLKKMFNEYKTKLGGTFQNQMLVIK